MRPFRGDKHFFGKNRGGGGGEGWGVDLKLGGINESMPESESVSVDAKLKADLDYLSRIESLLTQRRKVALTTFRF